MTAPRCASATDTPVRLRMAAAVLANADEGAIKFGQTQLVESNNIDLTDPVLRATYESNRDTGIATARTSAATISANNARRTVRAGSPP